MNLNTVKKITNHYFSSILVISCAAGFFIPNAGNATVYIIPGLLAAIVFSSFFQVVFSKETVLSNGKRSVLYFIFRFALFPIFVFFALKPFAPFYAQAFFLLFLAPAAVSTPAFTKIFGGNTDLSAASVVTTNSLAIISIPFLSGLLIAGGTTPIDTKRMLITLIITILIPFFLHFPFRKIQKVKDAMIHTSSLITVGCLSVLVIIAVSRYKHQILAHKNLMLGYAALSLTAFIFMYLIGYYLSFTASAKDRISYSVCSGANNIGLAITLAILYFPDDIKIFFIVAQITWTIALFPAKYFFKIRHGDLDSVIP